MITVMNQPAVIQGRVEPTDPSRILGPQVLPAHNFFTVIRELVKAHPYHNQSDQENALAAVHEYEKRVLGNDHQHVVQETDHAPLEDVSQRPVPQGTPIPAAPAQAPLDYSQLAAAILALQKAEAEQNERAETPAEDSKE